jgi:phage shock protein PspC (stress-responsive transcriptional regulator)
MKKTITVNLNGRIFNIDEDAYQLLDNYLRNLRFYFRNEEGSAEILADFEARIEELLSERVRLGYNVINIEDTEKIIAQMGRPDDFGEKDEDQQQEKRENYRREETEFIRKKFYRNPCDKMLGGVCSGIAAYFGWNVSILRIVFIILALLTVLWSILAYLVLWLVVPEARTAEQKLEMQGKPITLENIGKTVAAGIDDINRVATANNNGCMGFLAVIFKICLIALGCFIGFTVICFIIAMFLAILGFGNAFMPFMNIFYFNYPLQAVIATCLVVGIPLVAVIYALISYLFKLKPLHNGVKWAGLILWIAALIVLPFTGFRIDLNKLHDAHKCWNWKNSHNAEEIYGDGNVIDRTETLSPVHSIEINNSLFADIQIEQGDNSLVINGDANIVDKIDVREVDGKLILQTKDNHSIHYANPLTIKLKTSIPIKEIEAGGVSRINLTSSLQASEVELDVSGAAHLNVHGINTSHLEADADGAGEISIFGNAQFAKLNVSGVAKIFAYDLLADDVSAEAIGAGLIECSPLKTLKGKAIGVSRIVYKNNPVHTQKHILGLGKIEKEY